MTENKVRPGAYINFEAVPKPTSNVGTRGIMTMPVAMTWGAANTIIDLYSTDLLNGNSLAKIGLTAFDADSLIFREALRGAYLAKIYRLDTGGLKATATVGTIDVSAKYAGTTGNKISVAILENPIGADVVDVVTFFDGGEKDRQTVPLNGDGLVSNDWVDFSVTSNISVSAGTSLSGGVDGTVETNTMTSYLAAVDETIWHTMAVPNGTAAINAQIFEYVKNKRDNTGRKVQAVLVDYAAANHESIISVNQGYINLAGEKVTPAIFSAKFAGMTAGAAVNQSNTYAELNDAVKIINPVKEEDIENALRTGQLIITRRQDGAIVVEKDINSLHTFTPKKDYQFSKNRVIRVLDDIANQTNLRFGVAYIGKVDNNENGRAVFRADLISYMNELQSINAIQNFDPSTDITVLQGMEIDSVRVDLWIQPVDAMEKLYMRVFLGGND